MVIEIDLSVLYETKSPDCHAYELLKTILDMWGLKYTLLMNCNPAVESKFFSSEFKEFYEEKESLIVRGDIDEEDVVAKFADRKKAEAIVLFDGFEWAYALIYR